MENSKLCWYAADRLSKTTIQFSIDHFSLFISQNWYELIGKVPTSNWTAVAMSAFTIFVLFLNNEWLKPKMSKLCIVPMPIQLIAAVAGTLASKYFDLSANYNIVTVGHIPRGFPGLKKNNI